MKAASTSTIRINDRTHRLLKGLAGLNGVTLTEMVERLARFWVETNQEAEECKLCQKFGHEPNETTLRAMEEADRLTERMAGERFLKSLDKEFRDA